MTALELTLDNLASITDLDLEPLFIPACLEHSAIFHQVPFIKVGLKSCIVILQVHVDLKFPDLVKHRAYVFDYEFGNAEFVVEESVSEHHVFPHVEVFLKGFIELFAAIVLNEVWVEKSLGNSDKL